MNISPIAAPEIISALAFIALVGHLIVGEVFASTRRSRKR